MIVRPFILVLVAVLAFLGCSRPMSAPAVKYVDIGVDEESHPASVAVLVENAGNGPAVLKSAKAKVGWSYLITGKVSATQLPPTFDFELTPTAGTQLAPNSRGSIEFDFIWKTEDAGPPMLAIIHATLALDFEGGQTVQTIPITLLVRSYPEIALSQSKFMPGEELAIEIKSLPGWKSPSVEGLFRGPD